MSNKNNKLDLKTVELLDQILGQIYKPTKDSSCEESKKHTRVYEIPVTNPHPKIMKVRLWFDQKTGQGTVKIRSIPYSLVSAAGTFTMVQAGALIQQILAGPK